MSGAITFNEAFVGSWVHRLGALIEEIESREFHLRFDAFPEDNEIVIIRVPHWLGDKDKPKFAFFSSIPFDLGEVFCFVVAHGFREVALQLARGVDGSQDWYYKAIQAA